MATGSFATAEPEIETDTLDAIQQLFSDLPDLADEDLEAADDLTLARYIAALKKLENVAEDVRKETFEPVLHERVDEHEAVGPLTKQTGSRRYIEDEERLLRELEQRDHVDPRKAMRFNAKDAEELIDTIPDLDADDLIGQSEYVYFRR